MKFTTKTEYGLVCLIHLARQGEGEWIRVKDIVGSEGFSSAYIEKILQRLKAAGIVRSHQGKDGGYTLARRPAEITVKDIIEALEGATFDVYCEPELRKDIVCTHFTMCGIRPIWRRTKDLLDDFFGSLTLEAIAKKEAEVII